MENADIWGNVMVEICVICKNAQQVCADCYRAKLAILHFDFCEIWEMVIIGEILNSVTVGICEI